MSYLVQSKTVGEGSDCRTAILTFSLQTLPRAPAGVRLAEDEDGTTRWMTGITVWWPTGSGGRKQMAWHEYRLLLINCYRPRLGRIPDLLKNTAFFAVSGGSFTVLPEVIPRAGR